MKSVCVEPEGVEVRVPEGACLKDILSDCSKLDPSSVWGAKIGDKIVDIFTPLPPIPEGRIRLIRRGDPEALELLRHSCAHVMARAVMRLFPGVQLAFGPTVEDGFYYDFLTPRPLSVEDFPAIEAEMAKIIAADEAFERIELSREEALELCRDLGQRFKVEHIEDGLRDEPVLSFYRQGEFVDLCGGPHIPSAGQIPAFKLLSVAGAYWKGDASREQLQRVYGTAWFSREDLENYLRRLEEAKKRDHRILGRQLELFLIDPAVGPGLVLWLPKGAIIRRELENFIYQELLRRGYQPVYTPHIGRVFLYETSGHFPYYADSQFPPMQLADGERYLLKPMNCPHHVTIYKSKPRSYRELPLRLAELGTVYRFEQSGELSGMTRVRGFTQDDAHIFCTEDQVADEFRACVEMTQYVLGKLGLTEYRVRLGFRDPKSTKYVGSDETWAKAEKALEDVCRQMGLPNLSVERGEAAFYGPKADFLVTDCIGREWQLGTVQLDYNLPSPQRFNLAYIGPDNAPHHPVMIHRAPFGSLERFVGILIEHFAGAFPLWLSPEQVRVMSVSEQTESYAREVAGKLAEVGLRVQGDYRPEKISSKIRDAQLEQIPYMVIVGRREEQERTISVRHRRRGDLGAMSLENFIAQLREEIATKAIT